MSLRTSAAFAVVTTLALLGPTSIGEARSALKWRVISGAAGAAVSDGSRYAAFDLPGGITRIIDTKRRTSFDEATPLHHRLADVGGGELLWSGPGKTPDSVSSVVLLNLATRVRHRPPGIDDLRRTGGTFESTTFDRVGAYGLSAHVTGYHYEYRLPYDWHSGKFLHDVPQAASPNEVEDLDRPGLTARLCRPLTVRGRGFEYDRRYGLGWKRPSHRLELSKCGSHHRRVLTRTCTYPCVGHQLGAHVATWLEWRSTRLGSGSSPGTVRARVFAYDIEADRTSAWLPLSGVTPPVVVHTRNRVFASNLKPGGYSGTDPFPYEVRVGRIPRP